MYKRPKLYISESLENIKDPDLANKYVEVQKEINSRYEKINNINSEIADLKSQLENIENQAQQNREQREEAQQEMEEEEGIEESFNPLREDNGRQIILPLESEDDDDTETYYPEEEDEYEDYPYNKRAAVEDEEDAFDYEDEEDKYEDIEDEDDEETGEYVFYVEVYPHDESESAYAKVYKTREGENWEVTVGSGENEALEDMTFEEEYDKLDIISYLSNFFEDVEEISEDDYLGEFEVEEDEEKYVD